MAISALKKKLLRFVARFFGINAIAFLLFGLCYLNATLQSSTLFANYFIDYNTTIGKTFIISYWILYYLSYLSFLAFIPAIPLLLLAYFFPRKAFIFVMSILFAFSSLILLIIDTQIFSRFHFHLNTTLLTFFIDARWIDIFGFSKLELGVGAAIFGLLLALETAAAYLVWQKIIKVERFHMKHPIFVYWLGISLYCNLALIGSMQSNHLLLPQQSINFPLYGHLMSIFLPKNQAEVFSQSVSTHYLDKHFSDARMHYPLHPLRCKRPSKPYNLIYILIDSLRFDGVSSHDMPTTTAFAAQNWQFLNHFSGGNCTQPGLFTLFYSLPNNYWTAALKHKMTPVLIQLLSQYRYAFGVFWSSPITKPAFDKTIYQSIANSSKLYSSTKSNVGDRDQDITQHAIAFLKHHDNQPFYLNVFYDAAHSYCLHQNFSTPHIKADKSCLRLFSNYLSTDSGDYLRYRNALFFLDKEIAKIIQTIKDEGYYENSIIVISSDHGEEFNDTKRNVWGHSSSLDAAQTHIPLIIHWPKESAKIFDYVTTSYDLTPTILQNLFACDNATQDYSIGQNLVSSNRQSPYPIIVGSYANMGFIEPERLTVFTPSGGIAITDRQSNPIPHEKPHLAALKKVLTALRFYYDKQ